MAYDESLAARARRALAGRDDVVEQKMFGGVSFMVAGNMCCGVLQNDLILRLAPETQVSGLKSPHIRAWDFMKRPMRGMFAVNAAGCRTQDNVDRWVKMALGHALSMPPKKKKPRKKRTSAATISR